MGTDAIAQSLFLAPYVGKKDKDAEKILRLKRWQARRWMRENEIIEICHRRDWKPA